MNPWKEVLECIEAGDDEGLTELLGSLNELGRQAVAGRLPDYLAGRLREGRWKVQDQAAGFRLAGAACLGGAAQVATWLNRRELRRVRDAKTDATRILSLLRDRPQEWREDLAVRLVGRLRPPSGPRYREALDGVPGWQLAAGLVMETGIEPPDEDLFVVGWAWHLARMRYWTWDTQVLEQDPLLDHLAPRLFSVQGVAGALLWNEGQNAGCTIAGDLAGLAASGRLSRRMLLDGCHGRFLAGGEAGEIAPFVTLWRELRSEVAEIPVRDFVRLLPSACSPFVQLAVEELRRADQAGALGDELFGEAVGALVFRAEKKHVTAAVKWIGEATPARADGALAALATVFGQDTPALRDRAVRLAIKLAPHASDPGRDAVHEAAVRLPDEQRDRVAAVFGAVETVPEEPVSAVLAVTPLPEQPPPILSPWELADELAGMHWLVEPAQAERILAALVELAHEDREGVAAALRPWWQSTWQPFDADRYRYEGYDRDVVSLLSRCALAVVAPPDSRELSKRHARTDRPDDCVLPLFVRRRLREVIELFEAGRTLPVLLATPTAPTGHVDAATLVGRMERLGGAEPLDADFHQALLRLPRQIDQEQATRAEKLTSRAGRALAAWLRAGGLPDPAVVYGVETVQRPGAYDYGRDETSYVEVQEPHVRVTPSAGLPDRLRTLWTVGPRSAFTMYPQDMRWWPMMMPSHREVVAAYLLECLPPYASRGDDRRAVLPALAHGDGPVGAATVRLIAVEMGHKRANQGAGVVDALITLAGRGELPFAELGRAVERLIKEEMARLGRVTAVLDEVTAAGAHAEVWAVLAEALPGLLPAPGERPRAGLGDLLAVAVKAATLAGARADIPRLAEVAARKGASRVTEEARRLHRQIAVCGRAAGGE